MPLCRLVYFSENQLNPEEGSVLSQLSAILKVSNRNNKANGITGALVFDDLWFIQALEGERAQVWKTFERLKEDERHARVTLAGFYDIEERLFGNWWMGLATRTDSTLHAFAPYLHSGRLQPSLMTAKALLSIMTEIAKLGLARELMAA